ncbi:MAG: hypothetical protein LBQ40_07765 [Clostridiales bacterium]|jgi:hypothetical protein|nr:hypothetical protein [Clostridiales bacterium]
MGKKDKKIKGGAINAPQLTAIAEPRGLDVDRLVVDYKIVPFPIPITLAQTSASVGDGFDDRYTALAPYETN